MVQRDEGLILPERSGLGPAQLLHVGAGAESEANIEAQLAYVRARLAAHTHEHIGSVDLQNFQVVDGPDAQLFDDGRLEGRLLEYGSRELPADLKDALPGLRLMNMHEADVLLSRQKKSIHHARRISQENRQNSRHLGVQECRCARLSRPPESSSPRPPPHGWSALRSYPD